MLWSAVLAGLCGALAVLFTRVLIRDAREERGRYTIVVTIVFVMLNSTARSFVLPHIRAWEARSEARRYLESDRLWSLLSSRHPEVGERFTAMMVDLARSGASSEQAQAKGLELGRSTLAVYFSQDAPHASSASLVGYVSTMVSVLEDLESKNPQGCYHLLFGEGTEGSSTLSSLTAEQKQGMLGTMTAVLESAIRNPEEPPEPSRGSAIMEQLVTRLASTHDEEFMRSLSALSDPHKLGVDQAELCRTTLEMYRILLKMSDPDRTLLMRHLFAATN